MSIYPLIRANKNDRDVLTPQNTYYSEEYCKQMCDLYLTTHYVKNGNGQLNNYYRLHAKHDHTQEMAFAYEIKCPKCGNTLKQVGRQNTYTELGLYTCKHCNKD